MKVKLIKALLAISGIALLFAFQNCSKAEFVDTGSIDFGQGADTSVPPVVGEPGDDGSSLKSRKWSLVGLNISDKDVDLSAYKKFEWQFINVIEDTSGLVCPGGCGLTWKIQGVSFCNSIHGIIHEYFDESQSTYTYQVKNLEVSSSKALTTCNEDDAYLDEYVIKSMMNLSLALKVEKDHILFESKMGDAQMYFHETHPHLGK